MEKNQALILQNNIQFVPSFLTISHGWGKNGYIFTEFSKSDWIYSKTFRDLGTFMRLISVYTQMKAIKEKESRQRGIKAGLIVPDWLIDIRLLASHA